ncbi:EF-hand domain-containing protein [Actinocorallia sp. API 0066]|uniref:EF-hand domain-containing protein n=1 Tax=Actinocorallia sp. API 0066 TaxID=2896846 RepID=UPI001E65C442|nr:EF-hand domain-containing protein [Actinocorallia sp. API 0066]MCD0451794.1 EF-hand domain-containing protein [Actinocorallia sp. API 0066]
MTMTSADPISFKVDALFRATDANSDGVIEWNDLGRIVDRYLTAYKIDRNDRKAYALLAAYQMYWLELLRHAHGQDRLSSEQYHAATRALVVDTSRMNMVEGLPHAVFDIIDTDGDNTISRAEFAKHLDVWGLGSPTSGEVFARLDTDGDGEISRHEFIRAVREFYYAPDLDSPGSVFFGALPRV